MEVGLQMGSIMEKTDHHHYHHHQKRSLEEERMKKMAINFEETELRLGLPGDKNNGGEANNSCSAMRKRGFCETQIATTATVEATTDSASPAASAMVVDLKLNLFSNSTNSSSPLKDPSPTKALASDEKSNSASAVPVKPPAKAQVVGWPPVRSFRKNMMASQKSSDCKEEAEKAISGAAFVKVSMDGAPYLRKVDLKMYKSYQELSEALANMFSSFTAGSCGPQGIVKDFMNERKLMDMMNGSDDYVPTYEDKDGDWMLVGDVPWEMFVESCKRLRIAKGTEAIGFTPKSHGKMQEQPKLK